MGGHLGEEVYDDFLHRCCVIPGGNDSIIIRHSDDRIILKIFASELVRIQ
jgi:hypothetical protein